MSSQRQRGVELPEDYEQLLGELKTRVTAARTEAQRVVNTKLIHLYWNIGRAILARQHRQGWGAKVIGRLAEDLRREFPEMKGFSTSNLHYMRAFAEPLPRPGRRSSQFSNKLFSVPQNHSIRRPEPLVDDTPSRFSEPSPTKRTYH